jgi:hypothetical protein
MNTHDSSSVELLGEAAATRAVFHLLLEAAEILLASSAVNDKPAIVSALAARLKQKRGELLAPMPKDASPELQAHGNRTFQQEFERLSGLIADRLGNVAKQ